MAAEKLDFILGLLVTDMHILFVNASPTLFRVEPLVSIVLVGQDNVLGSGKLSKERDKLRE